MSEVDQVICQGCGVTGNKAAAIRYSNVESGLTFLYLCPLCGDRVEKLMAEVLSIVRTPYAHFRNFIPADARSNIRS